ncbi:cytochrome P450 [Streptomonospora nanhaiensis]|uniref:Cytochrome P450 n=1 Tax=Streptomonospora nanhaiensis TaxID=1323731 RepID=A0A853BUB0_9ACTN|nr:cytochrome P450 [Streptomonospora nanhaiensis]NYI98335.1 cytochrome P450 [Streptomonospora nanhaiensis]
MTPQPPTSPTPETAAAPPPLPGLPTERPAGCPFDPPAELGRVRRERPLAPMAYPDGHVGWLATGHAVVRTVLGDPRFSSRYELMRLPVPGMPPGGLPPAPPGDLTGIDPPEHTRYRRLLAGRFTVRRMRLLTERVTRICAEHLDAMERQGPPADLVAAYARPVPAMVICELLGVPYADRDRFQRHAEVLTGGALDEDTGAAAAALSAYLGDLVRAKRAEPTDDLLSELAATDLTDDELTTLGVVLLGAGLDTTANMIALGTFALLRNPDRLAELRADPQLVAPAAEELLRYLSIAHTGARVALEDVELAGHTIRAGDTVAVSLQAANRDPLRFAGPDTLDPHRSPTGHLAFGHGVHACVGQQLARVELRIAYRALLSRLPGLRLAVAPEEVPVRVDATVHGVVELPVTWDEG